MRIIVFVVSYRRSIPEKLSKMPYETVFEPFEDYVRVAVSGDRESGHKVNGAPDWLLDT